MKKNILLSIIALVACGSAVAGVASLSTNTVSANGASFYSEGASVKITSSVDDAQVRFNATMTDDFYNGYFTNGEANANVETGMLVVPYDVYVNSGVAELTLETKDACRATAVDTTTLWTDAKTDGYMESYAVLPANAIPMQSHNRALLFVAYVTDGTTPVYTAERKTSMSYVAWKAQSADESVVSATNKQALKDAYMHDYTVTFNDEYAREMTLEYGTYLNEQTSKTLYWDEACTHAVADTDYVSYSAQVYVKDKDVNELLSFDYASDVDTKNRVALTSAGNQQAEWLESYAGESGVMKIMYDNTEAKNNWVPQYTITPVVDLTGYSEDYSLHAYATENDYDYVVARMYIVNNESVTSAWTNVRMNGWSNAPSETVVYNEWVDYVFPVSALGTEYGSLTHSFKEQVKICGKDTVFGLGEYYVAGVWLEKVQTQYTFTEDNYSDYITSYVTGSATASVSWNDTAEAVQIDYNGTGSGTIYPGFTLKDDNVNNYADVVAKGYDYFTIDVFYATTDVDPYDANTTITATLNQYVSCNKTGKMLLGTMDGSATSKNSVNKWIKLIVPIEALDGDNSYYGRMAVESGSVARMYVKGFEFLKTELDVEVTGGTNGLVANEALSVSVTENGEAVTSFKGYAARTTSGYSEGITNGTFTVDTGRHGTWYVFVVSGDKVGFKVITVDAAVA